MNTHDEIKRMLIETAHSSKGHFKTASWIKLSLAGLVFVPLLTSLIQTFFDVGEEANRILSFVGLLFSCLALNSVQASNRDKAVEKVAEHMALGNEYLALHKEIRVKMSGGGDIGTDMLDAFQTRISAIDSRTSAAQISFVGRMWSSFRIIEEMDLKWLVKPKKGDRD